jgi:hypothetical protein
MTREGAAAKIMSQQRVVGRYRKARHPRPVDGSLVIGATYNNQAVLLWHTDEPIGVDTLRSMYHEARELGLETPLQVYGRCCLIADDGRSFTFHQIDY